MVEIGKDTPRAVNNFYLTFFVYGLAIGLGLLIFIDAPSNLPHMSSSSSSPFRSLGDLLNPNCPIARQAEAEARQEAEQIERIRKAVAEREASRARWQAMTKDEKEEAMMEWDGYPEE